MKILFVSESIWMKGPVFDLHMMAEGLAQNGHTVLAMDPGEEIEKSAHLWLECDVARYTTNSTVRLISPHIVHGKYGSPIRWLSTQLNTLKRQFYGNLRSVRPLVGQLRPSIYDSYFRTLRPRFIKALRGVYRSHIKTRFPNLLPTLHRYYLIHIQQHPDFIARSVTRKLPYTPAVIPTTTPEIAPPNVLPVNIANTATSQLDSAPNKTSFALHQRNRSKVNVGIRWIQKQYNRFRIRYRTMDALLQREPVDIIVLYSVSRLGIISLLLARKYKIPIVFRNVDMLHKLWADKREQYFVRQCEKIVYRRVNHLCALTPRYAYYLQNLGANAVHSDLVLFPIDTVRFNPAVPHDALRKKWDISASDKIVVFMGALYPFGGLPQLIECVDSLFTQVPNAKLLIVGDGVIRQQLANRIQEKGLDGHIILTGHEPFELMPSYITLADVCINVFPINDATNDIFSAKVVQYLACGRPTVSSALRGVTTLIPVEGAGVIFRAEIVDIVNETAQLLIDTTRHDQMARDGIAYVSEHHAFAKVLGSLERILLTVRNQHR